MASKNDRLSETVRFIELWQTEESLWNLFRNIHTKTPVLESLFNEVASLKGYNFMKKGLQHKCFPLSSFLYRTSPKVASDYRTNKRSGKKKRKKVLEEYQKEKILFMYKYLFLLLAQARN